MKYTRMLAVATLFLPGVSYAQQKSKPTNFDEVRGAFNDQVTKINSSTNIVTARGFNLFLQRRLANYLTGASDISLYEAYATYSSENDKLNFGFNIPFTGPNGKIRHLVNPMLETTIKNSFATLYKKSEWQADIRVGFKYSWFPAKSTINYFPIGTSSKHKQQEKMFRKRSAWAKAINDKIDKEKKLLTDLPDAVKKDKEIALAALDLQEEAINRKPHKLGGDYERLETIDNVRKRLKALGAANEIIDYEKKLLEYETELAKNEAEALEEKWAYTWSQTPWVSVWGFYPLTSRNYYLTPNETTIFNKQQFNPWELNLQGSYLVDGRPGVALLTVGYKIFQNNSALADLMKSVDYDQYVKLPGADPMNFAKLETNKAFIGDYSEFITNNLNVQLVLMGSSKGFINGGISVRYEKNFGEYSAANIRLGVPFRFKGKEKPINIEPQLRFNDVGNFRGKADYKVEPTFGINIGVPFSPLFK